MELTCKTMVKKILEFLRLFFSEKDIYEPNPRITLIKEPDVMPEPPKPTPMPTPKPILKWDTVANSRHSVRVICDEEGLTVKQKNELCATVGAESGWQSYYLSGPKKGQPVKLENKKGETVWSTDWGICQINSWYNIKEGFNATDAKKRPFPTAKYVLDNPEACVRWMCKMWKLGYAEWWIAYKNGSYKRYL